MKEMNQARVTAVVHTIAAIFMGWASVMIQQASRALFAVGAGIVVLIVVGYALQFALGRKGFKFWFGSGIIIYLLLWLVSWIVFFNL